MLHITALRPRCRESDVQLMLSIQEFTGIDPVDATLIQRIHLALGIHRMRDGRPVDYLRALRVMVDPDRARDRAGSVEFQFDDGSTGRLELRHGVAVCEPGESSDARVTIRVDDWADVLRGSRRLAELVEAGAVELEGDRTVASSVLGVFDLATLHLE